MGYYDESFPFLLKLFQKLHEPGQNLVVSPFSILSTVSMVLAGCASETRAELLKVLFKQSDDTSDEQFTELLEAYLTHYQALVERISKQMGYANFLYSHPE